MKRIAFALALLLSGTSMALAGGSTPTKTADLQVNNNSTNTAVVIVDVSPTQQSELFAGGITRSQQEALIASYTNARIVNGKASTVFKDVTVGTHTVVAVFPNNTGDPITPAEVSAVATYNVQQQTKNNKTTATIHDGSGGVPVLAFKTADREFLVASIGLGNLALFGLAIYGFSRKAKS